MPGSDDARTPRLAEPLEKHVRVLSETIGERSLYCPTALADAADHIELTQLLNCAERLVRKLCDTKTGRLK